MWLGITVFWGFGIFLAWWMISRSRWELAPVVVLVFVLGVPFALVAIRVRRSSMGQGEPPLQFDDEGLSISPDPLRRRRRRVLWSEVDGYYTIGKDPGVYNANYLVLKLRRGGTVPISDKTFEVSIDQLVHLVQTRLADSKTATASIAGPGTE
jgi:hypothetical protein